MTLDINPVVPENRQLIQSYGDGRFKVTGEVYESSILIFPDRTEGWGVIASTDISVDSLDAIVARKDAVDILLVGCGPTFTAIPKGLRAGLKEHGIVLEWMDTGAACRTFNVLVAEERRVAAAIIAVD
ncbi:MAG: Mth938-like domain-containing protein [Rhodospirillales bacterium]|nr:Mth938-like domain-containing protein [Rhodospirillales bacterium]MBO6786493.1 Mth938-like domain-containing protein [Rhodospirillales bacterium]